MRHPICQQRINSRLLTRVPQEPSAEIRESGGGKAKQIAK
jgi:hypothetical protein